MLSNFVRDEARYALFHKKLIATKVADLDVMEIPFGFQSQQTDDVLSLDNIIRAIEKLGLQPTAKPAIAEDTWEQIRQTRSAETVLSWIGANPSHPSHAEAVALMGELLREPEVANATPTASEPIVRRSKVAAFFRGLTFQLPEFQLTEEGRWSSIGLNITLWLLFISNVYVWISVLQQKSALYMPPRDTLADAPFVSIAVLGIHTLLSPILSYLAIVKWGRQQNFKAVWTTTPVYVLSALFLVYVSFALVVWVVGRALWEWETIKMLWVMGLLLVLLLVVPFIWWKLEKYL